MYSCALCSAIVSCYCSRIGISFSLVIFLSFLMPLGIIVPELIFPLFTEIVVNHNEI
jgi:hypothetical protein